MKKAFLDHLKQEIRHLKAQGLYKIERTIASPQNPWVKVHGQELLCLCANNYLGLASHPELQKAARAALHSRGFGMASVRFICGTQDLHRELEDKVAHFLGTEDAQLYSSCFDANGAIFDALFDERDAIISDALNHASIIDGIRLCKAQRFRYANSDMADLERQLKAASGARFRLIVTDGVFSMDGFIARLPEICDLADRYDAMVMVDDSHAVGFMGAHGRGTPEHCGVEGRVDILTGTFGKALGGGCGGYIAGKRVVIEWLRQRSRPYLFSNSVPPPIAAATLRAFELLEQEPELMEQVKANGRYFRTAMVAAGFEIPPGEHPIVPVMLHDAPLAQEFARRLLDEGVYVIGFFYPVVPKGKARIRTQMCAAHTREDLDRAIAAFVKVGRDLCVVQ
nr:glycine C-acetyltransferase [uncultured Holophaga sp.]